MFCKLFKWNNACTAFESWHFAISWKWYSTIHFINFEYSNLWREFFYKSQLFVNLLPSNSTPSTPSTLVTLYLFLVCIVINAIFFGLPNLSKGEYGRISFSISSMKNRPSFKNLFVYSLRKSACPCHPSHNEIY